MDRATMSLEAATLDSREHVFVVLLAVRLVELGRRRVVMKTIRHLGKKGRTSRQLVSKILMRKGAVSK